MRNLTSGLFMGRYRKKISKKKLMEAIEGSGGIISVVAKRLNVSWHTAKKAIEENPETKQIYDDESDRILDVAENVILKAIKNNDVSTAKWYLSNKGKFRGYGEIDLSMKANISFVDDMSEEE